MTTHDKSPRPFRASADPLAPLAINPDALAVTFQHHDVEDVADLLDGGIAVVCIEGPLEHKGGGSWWSFFDSYEAIYCRYKVAIECEDVRAILLKIDSPGGDAAGMNETCRRMRALKRSSGKPVIAYADECAASAAYGLACVADEIYLPKSGGVGSVGVIATLCDASKAYEKMGIRFEFVTSGKRKADGHPEIPLAKDVIARVQHRVDGLAQLFWKQVAKARGMSVNAVRELEAGMFFGKDAVAAGLADGAMPLDEVIAGMKEVLDSGGTSVSLQNASNGGDSMTTLAKLKAAKDAKDARDKAEKSLHAAKEKDRAKLALAYAAADAKYRKVTRSTEEEDDGESESTGSGSSMSSTGSSTGSSSSASSSMSESASASAAEEEEDERRAEKKATKAIGGDAMKLLKAAGVSLRLEGSGLYSRDRLVRLVRKITGEESLESMMGALDAIGQKARRHDKLAARVDRIEKDGETKEKDALIKSGVKHGRVAPALVDWLSAQSLAQVKGYIAHAPKVVDETILAGDGREPRHEPDAIVLTEQMRKEWTAQGYKEEDFPRLLKAHAQTIARQNWQNGQGPKPTGKGA